MLLQGARRDAVGQELRCESQLLDPADEPTIYLALRLQNLRFTDNRFGWIVPLDTAQ